MSVASISRFVLRHKMLVVLFWVVATVAGVAAAGPATDALSERFDLPGREGTEANAAILERYGNGGFAAPYVVVVTLPEVRPEHRGGLGTAAINGGVIAAMFDFAIGCTPALKDPTRRAATMQLSMSFERPLVGESVRAEATIDSAGSSTLFASARMYDAQGQVCARCQGVVKVSQMKWASGQSPAIN